jgi:hypothetical protein
VFYGVIYGITGYWYYYVSPLMIGRGRETPPSHWMKTIIIIALLSRERIFAAIIH